MPLRKLANIHIIEPNSIYKDKYWPKLTEIVWQKYGEQQVDDPLEVQPTLKACFEFLCSAFRNKLADIPNASFFVFVQDLHEDSIDLMKMLLHENYFQINTEDFAASRRIMKYILEQGCTLDLVGHSSFSEEISENLDLYISHLEELIYIGTWAFALCEYIARSQICKLSISLKVEENELTIYVNVPFNTLFKFVVEDNKRHNSSVVLSDSILGLKKVLNEKVNLNYDHLYGLIYEQIKDDKFRFSVFNLDELIEKLERDYTYSREVLDVFYSGLTINRNNVISVEEGILKTQDARRHMYRPILEYTIDGKKYWIIGGKKWAESLAQLTTNCIPFGQFPEEWKRIPDLYRFMKHCMDTHDSLLENPAIEIIEQVNLKYDRNIKSFKKKNNQGVSILKKDLGEIDILFIDENYGRIFVAECKHNRARFEFYNWRRDISNFEEKYERQLSNKYNWVKSNRALVLEHFEVKYNCSIDKKDKFVVTPLFIINAPTLYMYDSEYLVFTLADFRLYLNQNHKEVEFDGEVKGVKHTFRKPYFKNIQALMSAK
ncbi:hypothetical protein [Aurantibacillus circumpalustris]|uniref:hypothetical protein n=1 Tax=Aurantibacillus circumpalustris TaxID=3036359 RepID=UPI00295AAEB0|nr:hypothetical protein [Aurantibacillus circumpalustris]